MLLIAAVFIIASPVGAARVHVDAADEGEAAIMVTDNWCDSFPNPALVRSFGTTDPTATRWHADGQIEMAWRPVLFAEDSRTYRMSDPYSRMGVLTPSDDSYFQVQRNYASDVNDKYWWIVQCQVCSPAQAGECTFTNPRNGRRLFWTRPTYKQWQMRANAPELVGAGDSRVMGANGDQFFDIERTDDGKFIIKATFGQRLSGARYLRHGEHDVDAGISLYMGEDPDGENVWPEELWSIDPVPGLGQCAPVSTSSHDAGYIDAYHGWYDLQGCGQCNDYCRWVGGEAVGSGGDPARRLENGDSWWSCRLAGSDDAYTPRGHFTSFDYTKCEAVPATPRR